MTPIALAITLIFLFHVVKIKFVTSDVKSGLVMFICVFYGCGLNFFLAHTNVTQDFHLDFVSDKLFLSRLCNSSAFLWKRYVYQYLHVASVC